MLRPCKNRAFLITLHLIYQENNLYLTNDLQAYSYIN